MLDQGIYPVTLGHLLLGEPDQITAAGIVRDDGVDLSEHFTLDYRDGRFVHGAASMMEFLDMSASIAGTRGWITIDPAFWSATRSTIHGFGPKGEPTAELVEFPREGHGYTPMLRAVTEAIQRGEREHPMHTLSETASVFDTLDAIRAGIVSPG